MHPLLLSFYHTLYPVKEEPDLKRDRPLQVLCLGISRSGTDSLRNALSELGYADVHHGYRFLERPGEILQWLRLAYLKRNGHTQDMTAEEFDKCLGDCEAVTDIATAFAHEPITAYPDAKVVLNYREDVDAWHASVKKTIGVMDTSWLAAIICYFQRDMFWQRQAFLYMWRRCYGGNFERDGRQWYREHYSSLEQRLRKERGGIENQPYLKWKVDEGWEPLCRYLGKAVPEKPFPSGNTPKDFQSKMDTLNEQRLSEAKWNILLTLAVVIAIAGGLYAMGRRQAL